MHEVLRVCQEWSHTTTAVSTCGRARNEVSLGFTRAKRGAEEKCTHPTFHGRAGVGPDDVGGFNAETKAEQQGCSGGFGLVSIAPVGWIAG